MIGETLKRADEIINGERQDDYGSPEDSFGIIAAFWELHLNYRKPGSLRADDIAIMMSLFKHARMYGQKWAKDNAVDACGYLAILNDRLKCEQAGVSAEEREGLK
jgi:hypothetical protein